MADFSLVESPKKDADIFPQRKLRGNKREKVVFSQIGKNSKLKELSASC